MGALTQLGEALRQFFVDPFEDGVRRGTPRPVYFMDPNELNDPDMAKNIARLRGSLGEQAGNPDFAKNLSDELLKYLIEGSRNYGTAFKLQEEDGKIVGLVGKLPSFLERMDDHVFHLAGVAAEKMRRVPGDDYLWKKFWGIHEGTHINQEPIYIPIDTSEKICQTLQNEVEADRAGIEYLRGLGREDMAQAFMDYRALGAARNASTESSHSTAIFLRDGGPAQVTDAHVQAARNFKMEMDRAVAQELGVSLVGVWELFNSGPEKYIDAVDRMLEQGRIGSTPEIAAYIKDYAGAYRRQVLEAHLDPAPPRREGDKEAPQPEKPDEPSGHVHAHHSDAGSHTKIDGQPAPGYFNARAAGAPQERPAPEAGSAPAVKPVALIA